MPSLSRREFVSLSLGGLTALGGADLLLAKDSKKHKVEVKPAAPQFDTLFLTWQRDPTTTMTVQWIGPATPSGTVLAAGASIQYISPNQAVWKTVAAQQRPYHPESNLRVFRAELTGLTPGTEYEFRIGKDSSARRFRTMPAKATNAFQFVSGGDCGANEHVIANNILAAKQDPMFALIGGDVAYDNGYNLDANLAFLRNYSRHMVDSRGRMIPMVTCIGNHEVKGGYNAQRKDGPLFFSLFDGLFDDRSFATLDFGDYLSLVLLDTGHVAPIDGEQTSWLDQVLGQRVERPNLIVVNHVPAYPSYRKVEADGGKAGTGELNRTHWVLLFEKHNVDFVLEHHDHTFKRTHPLKDGQLDANGIVYLGDGSWGKLRSPKTPEARSYLATTDEAYHMTLHRLEGEQQFHMALEETGRVVDVCMTQKRPRRRMGRSA
jgi:hypothetical protein